MQNLEQYFEGVSGDYPLIDSKTGKKFRSRMLEYWYKMILKAQEEIIFDNTFMPTVCQVCWFTCASPEMDVVQYWHTFCWLASVPQLFFAPFRLNSINLANIISSFTRRFIQWITVLAGSHLRCVRHTSTVIALRIVDGLVNVCCANALVPNICSC